LKFENDEYMNKYF